MSQVAADISIFCRCRHNLHKNDSNDGNTTTSVPFQDIYDCCGLCARTTSCKFDDNFDQKNTQEEVFKQISPVADGVLAGHNGSVVVFGQPGSGKTFTLEGDKDSAEEKGLIFRSIDKLYAEIKAGATVSVSFYEIFSDESTRDLLAPSCNAHNPPKEVSAVDKTELLSLLKEGIAKRDRAEVRKFKPHIVLCIKVSSTAPPPASTSPATVPAGTTSTGIAAGAGDTPETPADTLSSDTPTTPPIPAPTPTPAVTTPPTVSSLYFVKLGSARERDVYGRLEWHCDNRSLRSFEKAINSLRDPKNKAKVVDSVLTTALKGSMGDAGSKAVLVVCCNKGRQDDLCGERDVACSERRWERCDGERYDECGPRHHGHNGYFRNHHHHHGRLDECEIEREYREGYCEVRREGCCEERREHHIEHERLQREIDCLTCRNEELENKLDKLQTELSAAKKLIEDKAKQCTASNAALVTKDADNTALATKVSDAEKKIGDLQKSVDSGAEQKTELAAARLTIVDLTNKLADAKDKEGTMIDLLDALKKHTGGLKDFLDVAKLLDDTPLPDPEKKPSADKPVPPPEEKENDIHTESEGSVSDSADGGSEDGTNADPSNAGVKFELTVAHPPSHHRGDHVLCVFQRHPNDDCLLPLAWLVQGNDTNTKSEKGRSLTTFSWVNELSAFYQEMTHTKHALRNEVFDEVGRPVDMAKGAHFDLQYRKGHTDPSFVNDVSRSEPNRLIVHVGSLGNKRVGVGLGMFGSPNSVREAHPNMRYRLDPEVEYYLTYDVVRKGALMPEGNGGVVPIRLKFPHEVRGLSKLSVEMNANHKFSVKG